MTNSSESNINKFLELLEDYILNHTDEKVDKFLESKGRLKFFKENCSDVVQVCMKHLTDENYVQRNDVYFVCETLLIAVAEHCGTDEGLFEILEVLETAKSDIIFTSALKALQKNLLRQADNKARALEWSLNSIISHVNKLEFSERLRIGYDGLEEKLLEEDPHVHQIIITYKTLELFFKPIVDNVVSSKEAGTFRNTGITKENVLVCFLLQLLDKPFAYLNFANDGRKTNMYTMECARSLITEISKLMSDPFYFLYYIENRVRWENTKPKDKGSEVSKNIFLIEEKVSLTSYGVYFYILLAEDLLPENAPTFYTSLHIFETCLYLVYHLLKCEEGSLQYKGIKLGSAIIEYIGEDRITSQTFELQIHSDFTKELMKVIVYSSVERNRKKGFELLKAYMNLFKDKDAYTLLRNLVENTTHNGLLGYLIVEYKNLVAEKLQSCEENEFPSYLSGSSFRYIILNIVCKLQQDVATDLMKDSDHIISALNVIRYFAISDRKNKTGFWDCIKLIESKFLNPLRKAIDLSRAHFKEEQAKVKVGKDSAERMKQLVDVSLMSGEDMPDIAKEEKYAILENALVTFDLIESILGRVIECIDNVRFK